MKLSRTVEYAVKATLQLAQNGNGTPVPCSQLAAKGDMPERFLLQILRNLVTHGILNSTRGVVGGYGLQRSLDQVSLLEIIEAFEGPLTSGAASTGVLAEPAQVSLGEAMAAVAANVRRELAAIKLSQFLPAPDCIPADAMNRAHFDDPGPQPIPSQGDLDHRLVLPVTRPGGRHIRAS